MKLWVDADACPAAVKEILYRAATRLSLQLELVANVALRVPASPFIRARRVEAGFDVVDRHIEAQVEAGDIVITADIPLAAAVVQKGGTAINPRGEIYTEANVREHLGRRDMLEELRGMGLVSGGPPPFSSSDRHAFAASLDRLLARRIG